MVTNHLQDFVQRGEGEANYDDFATSLDSSSKGICILGEAGAWYFGA